MKQIIDPETFERKASVEFFRNFHLPYITLTSEVECTGARERARHHDVSFFFYYTHALMKAINEIKEFRYRFDAEGQVLLYDVIHPIVVISHNKKGWISNIPIEYDDDLILFAGKAKERIDQFDPGNNPFSEELAGKEKETNLLVVSAIPTLSFTSVGFAQSGALNTYPLSFIGKVTVREGKEYIPIGITANHAFVDGFHLDKLYRRIEELLFF